MIDLIDTINSQINDNYIVYPNNNNKTYHNKVNDMNKKSNEKLM